MTIGLLILTLFGVAMLAGVGVALVEEHLREKREEAEAQGKALAQLQERVADQAPTLRLVRTAPEHLLTDADPGDEVSRVRDVHERDTLPCAFDEEEAS